MRRRTLVAVLFAIAGSAIPSCAFAQAPCTPLPPPSGVAAKVSGTFVVLTWTAPEGAPLGYVVEAGSAAGRSDVSVTQIDNGATEFKTDAPPARYYVRVRARDACGPGQPSSDIVVVVGVYQDHPDILVAARTPTRNPYFPSVTRITGGRLLAAYYDSPAHLSTVGRISMVESRDDGRTWSPPRVVLDTKWDDRDPNLTITRSGRLLLSYFAVDNGPAQSAGQSVGVFVVRSDDDGATWSEPARVETPLMGAATSSKIVETSNGDLLIPLYGANDDESRSRVTIVRSRDGGRTWPRLGTLDVAAVPGIDLSEPALAIAGERMLVIMRSNRSDSVAYATWSLDGGVTWSQPSTFGMAAQASELEPVPGAPAMTLMHVWADWSHHWGDSRPTVAQPVRWPAGAKAPEFGEPRLLYNSNCDDTGYPSATFLGDGRMFVAFYDACLGYIGGTYVPAGAAR